MYMDRFYPPGREKIHGQGALDWRSGTSRERRCNFRCTTCSTAPCAITSSVTRRRSGPPARPRLGEEPVRPAGAAPPAGGRGGGGIANAGTPLRERARAAMEAGYRCFRVDASIGGAIPDNVFNTHERVRLVAAACKEIREGVGRATG